MIADLIIDEHLLSKLTYYTQITGEILDNLHCIIVEH